MKKNIYEINKNITKDNFVSKLKKANEFIQSYENELKDCINANLVNFINEPNERNLVDALGFLGYLSLLPQIPNDQYKNFDDFFSKIYKTGMVEINDEDCFNYFKGE